MKLKLISAGAAQGLVGSVARQAGIEAAGDFGAAGAMIEKFLAGEACDVLILTRAQIDKLGAEGRIEPGTVRDLGGVAASVAVRAADAAPAVNDAQALRAAMRAADAIYFPDPARATAGIHFAKVLESLGIHDEVRARLRTFPNAATAMRELAQAGGKPIGCTQATEILATPGVRLVAPLPPGFDLVTVYTAAVPLGAPQPDAARDFVERLTRADARAVRAAAGFQ